MGIYKKFYICKHRKIDLILNEQISTAHDVIFDILSMDKQNMKNKGRGQHETLKFTYRTEVYHH
jgi:hypothetical protein